MSYLSKEELTRFGFKHLGKDVLISNKCSIYNPESISIGNNSRVDDFCLISGSVSIGNNVHVTAFCNLAGGNPGITIGDYATIAYGCHIFSQSDDYSGETMTNSTIPRKYKSETFLPVNIGRYAIIGARCVILPGCTIEEGCSIGAMSLVTKSTQAWSLYFGSPARLIKSKSKNLLNLLQAYLEEKNDSF